MAVAYEYLVSYVIINTFVKRRNAVASDRWTGLVVDRSVTVVPIVPVALCRRQIPMGNHDHGGIVLYRADL